MVADGWRELELHDVARVILGQSPPSAEVREEPSSAEDEIPFLQGNAEFNDRFPSASSWTRTPRRIAPQNSVLISVRAPVGDVNQADQEYGIGRGLAAIAANGDGALKDYLFWALSNAQAYYTARKQGTTFDAINKKDLKELPLALPPLPEQKKIAAILSSVDDAIAAKRNVIEQTKRVKKGLLQDLMTRGIGHTRFKTVPDSWATGRPHGLQELPADWRVVRLTEVARLESGHTPTRGRDVYWNGDISWISLHDTERLTGNPIIDETEMSITDEGLSNSSARRLPEGTVVLSRTATVGLCAIMGEEMATSQDFANYVCGPHVNNRFLCYLFRWMGPVWKSLSAGSTHQTVYMPDFRNLTIALPPVEEQKEIAGRLDSCEDALEANAAVIDSLNGLKRGLMQDLLSGRVRVSVD